MEARAVVRYVRITPRKARVVADLVRGRPLEQALDVLAFTPKKGARIVRKLIISAWANAEDRVQGEKKGVKLDPDAFVVRRIFVDQAPMWKRWRPAAHGRAQPRQKKNSHITVVLGEKD